MILCSIIGKFQKKFVGYPSRYSLDMYLVPTSARGDAGSFGYWVQPVGDGSMGVAQPVWVAY